MNVENTYSNISNLFVKLIGYINLILQYDSYQEDFNTYNEMLSFINIWAVQYEKQRNLRFIDNNDLINIYQKSDEMQTKYICNDSMGSESEFSDYVLNLLWDLRVIYKKSIQKEY